MLSDDIKRVVEEQRLGYAATVCPDGPPNLSPKGTTAVWDDDRLVFADILGLVAQSNADQGPDLVPRHSDRETAERFGRRIGGAAHLWARGGVSAVVTPS
jgi:uncharacterized protein